MLVLFDMDGVLCDFVSSALRVCGREDLIDQPWNGETDVVARLGLNRTEFWTDIERAGEAFWCNLEPNRPLVQFVRDLASTGELSDTRITVGISTSPSMDPACYSGKVKWLRYWLPKVNTRNYMLGSKKEWLAGHGRVLVDDRVATCSAFARNGGHSIIWRTPWNETQTKQSPLPNVDSLSLLERELSNQMNYHHGTTELWPHGRPHHLPR